jgi:pimeloyl-ACP methyl ester carboxylesterase
MKRLKQLLRSLAVILGGAWRVSCAGLWVFQEDILFPGRSVPVDAVYPGQVGARDVWVDRPDGARLHVLHMPAENAKGTVLYFHGNGAWNAYVGSVGALFGDMGYDVYSLDYRGYGKSRGARSEAAMLADALAYYDQIIDGEEAPIIVGRSLGTSFASYVAANRPVSKLIMLAPPSSIADVARRRFPVIPSALLRFPLSTDSWLAEVQAPITIIHGTQDNVVPIESGRLMKPLLKPGDRFIEVQGGGHNNLLRQGEVITVLTGELANP